MAFSAVVFALVTLLSGSLLFYWLSKSSSSRRRIMTKGTVFGTAVRSSSNDYLYDNGSLYVSVGGVGVGGAMFEVLISAIQTFSGLAVAFAQAVQDLDDIFPAPVVGMMYFLGVRFILGMAVIGSISFCSMLISMSIWGPMNLFNAVSGFSAVRRWRGGRRSDRSDLGQVVIVFLVLAGLVHTVWRFYKWLEAKTSRFLFYLEEQVLEVNPEERRRNEERRREQRKLSYIRRWFRNGKWKTRLGWQEAWMRFWFHVRFAVVSQWIRTRDAWARGLYDEGEVE